MKNRILKAYPKAKVKSTSATVFYIADFTDRTGSERGVEIHEEIPLSPDNNKYMDCMTVSNNDAISIDYHVFDDDQFRDIDNKCIEHCECCFYPTSNDDSTLIGFVEIKDCKPKNMVDYKEKVKNQIISTVNEFKTHGIIDSQNIYGIIGFPRKKKLNSNLTIFDDFSEYKRLYKEHKIHFFATNEIKVVDCKTISVV